MFLKQITLMGYVHLQLTKEGEYYSKKNKRMVFRSDISSNGTRGQAPCNHAARRGVSVNYFMLIIYFLYCF